MTLVLAPAASILVFALLGAGPGLYFDFATLSRQTPTCGSLCANAALVSKATNPRHATVDTNERMVSLIRSPTARAFRRRSDTRPENSRPRQNEPEERVA